MPEDVCPLRASFLSDIVFVFFAIFYDCFWASGVLLWWLIGDEAIRKKEGQPKINQDPTCSKLNTSCHSYV